MKILVIGLGSMGRRRIRLLQGISSEINVAGVDRKEERRDRAQEELGIATYDDLSSANLTEFDGFVISTPPLTHCAIIRQLLPLGIPIFTELNLVQDGYDEFTKEEYRDKIFLSSTFLYRNDIRYIKDAVGGSRVNYTYHTGQYLPDWHPWESYKDFFVQNRKTNGCREIMAIELPWITDVFGEIVDVTAKKDKMSQLEVDYNDNYSILVTHKNGTRGMISVDVVSRMAMRRLEVFSENIHLFWDGDPNSVSVYDWENKKMNTIQCYDAIDKNDNYCKNIIENAYQEELVSFLKMIETQSSRHLLYSFQKDEKILQLIDKIEG